MHNDSLLVRWSKFFVNRYRITLLILLAILIAGFWGVTNNQRQDFPTIPINFVSVTAIYPGASPADVEQDVLAPIEQAVSGFDGVESIRSTAQNSFGSVQVLVESVDQTDVVANDISNELGKIGLPDDVDASVQTFDAAGPSIALGLVGSNGETTEDLLQYAGIIQSRLEGASKDIKRVEVLPSNEFEIVVTLDASSLAQQQLSFDAVRSAIESQIASLPGGTLESADGRSKSITVNAPVSTLEDISSISLGQVKLEDIASIQRKPKQGDTAHFVGYVKDGEPYARESVYFLIYKKDNGDVITISQAVEEEMSAINSSMDIPETMEIVVGYDISPYVEDQLSSLLSNGYIGLVLILVVLLFFINLRTALVVALIIPIVLLTSLFALHVLEYTLNILTLFAMILTLGILVDNAIVIAEGIVHEIEKGAKKRDAAITAIRKLGPAVAAATATTVVVFIPFANIGGIMGDFLKYIPYTIIIVLVASFFAAVSITPLLGVFLIKEQTYEARRKAKIRLWEKILVLPAIVHYGQNAIDHLANSYGSFMSRVLKRRIHKFLVIAITGILLATSFVYFAPQLSFEQFPSEDGATIQVDFEFPVGTPQETKNDIFIQVQNTLIELPYFQTFYTFGDTIFSTFEEPVDRPDEKQFLKLLNSLTSSSIPFVKMRATVLIYKPPLPPTVHQRLSSILLLSSAEQTRKNCMRPQTHLFRL